MGADNKRGKSYTGVTYAAVQEHAQNDGAFVFIGRQNLVQVGDPQHVEIRRQGTSLIVVPTQGSGRSVHQGRLYVNSSEVEALGLSLGVYNCSVHQGNVVVDLSQRIDFDRIDLPQE